MTPAEISHTIKSFGVSRKQFAVLVGYPIQTVDRWCAPGNGNMPIPPAMVALLLVLRDMPHDARAASFDLLQRHDLRGRFRPLTRLAAPPRDPDLSAAPKVVAL